METSLKSPKIYCKYGDVPCVSKNLLQIWRRPRCLQNLTTNMETSQVSPKLTTNMETSLVSPKIYCKYGDVPGVSKNLLQICRRLRCLQKLSSNMETSLTSPNIYCKCGDVQGVSKNLVQIWRRP